MASPLEREFSYYLAHQDELAAMYDGKFVVIRGQQVVGTYATELEAIQASAKRYPVGTFLVQKCSKGGGGVTQTFHSRVAFA